MDTTITQDVAVAWIFTSEAVFILLTFLGTVFVAFLTSFLTYWLTRRTRLEAEWRIDKLKQYRELLVALSRVISCRDEKEEFRKATDAFIDSTNTLLLVASIPVLRTFENLSTQLSTKSSDNQQTKSLENIIHQLIDEIRKDLKITSIDKENAKKGTEEEAFQFRFIKLKKD